MSAQIISAQNQPDVYKLMVSMRLLLGLYAIIPVCLLLAFFDTWFWQDFLKTNLPSSPSHFLLFQILFGTPHIIASAVILVTNTEYLSFYKHKLLFMTAAIAIVFGIGSLFIPYRVFYLAVAAWTVFHVLKQQHGICRGVCRLPAWAFYLLLWLSVAAGFFIYVGIFLKNSLDVQQVEWLKEFAGGLCIVLLCSAVFCQRYVASVFGKCFLWANILLVLTSFYLYLHQYYFLAILVPRLVHDTTAYIFYVTHDYNKHHLRPKNTIYRCAAYFNLPIFIVLPLISFVLAFVLQAYGDSVVNMISNLFFGTNIRKAVTVGFLGYLGLMHYYTEAFTWKNDSPYRQFIAFTK